MRTSLIAIAVAASAAATSAQATTIDFNEFTAPITFSFDGIVKSQGYTFTATPGFLAFYKYGPGGSADPNGGSLAFSLQPPSAAVVTKDGGGLFDLSSLMATSFSNTAGSPFDVTFSFLANGVTSTETRTIDGLPGFQTFNFNRTGLSSFSFTGPLQIDNVVVNSAAATPAVPEPATWAMMLLGFGAMGGALRRRSQVAARIRFA